MEEQYLFISWNSKPPIPGKNIWRVNGDIEFKDGKLVFQIANGSNVSINPEQLERIGITRTHHEMEAEIKAIKEEYGYD